MEKSEKSVKSRRGSMHGVLQQTIAQVKACTLDLQQQRREQQNMQHVLQAMNIQTVALLDKAISAAIEQQHLWMRG